jgi:hypothetical protein
MNFNGEILRPRLKQALANPRHGIQAVTRVMAYVADAVTFSSTMCTGGIELSSSALTSSTLKWLH